MKSIPDLPRISVITPSFNQAEFIGRTIESVLSQNYPGLEYIIMDGGSTDGTIKLLKKYKKQFKWISRKDKGQSEAINKGLKMSTGEIVCFVNSDDYLEPGSLMKVGKFFREKKDAFILTGKCRTVDENGREVRKLITLYKNLSLKFFCNTVLIKIINFISQPSTFWRREICLEVGYLDEKLHYSMDYEYWLRILVRYPLYFIDEYLSNYRVHRSSKAVTSPRTQFATQYRIIKRYSSSRIILIVHKFHAWVALAIYRLFLIRN